MFALGTGAGLGAITGYLFRGSGDSKKDAEHRAEVRRLKQNLDALNQQIKRLDPTVENYADVKAHFDEQVLQNVQAIPDLEKLPEKSVAVMGKCCAGKTTLINKLFGLNLKASPLRNTDDFTKVTSTPLDVYDVFGANDRETYVHMETLVAVKAVHIVACLYTDCVESVVDLAKLLQALRSSSSKPFAIVFVRSKMDTVDAGHHDMIYDNDLPKLQQICPDCELVLVSSTSGMGLAEFERLL